ncbi:MAG TPA: DUF4157 domain-containing protein, partial [Thermomicrobiales bacterium]|nr:DUF4157 domain-containing protein [Thermomicrobiales bacterium]
MSAAHARPKARAKARPAATHAPAPARSSAGHAPRSAALGPHYAAGPVGGLALPAQTKLAVGQPGDAYEQQANAVANHVTSGSQLAPPSISPVTAGALARETATGPEKKKPEPTPAQKEAKPEEKKPAQTPVQKAGIPEPEKKEPEQKLAQRETAKTSKPEEKKPEAAVQKEETNKPPEKNPDPRAIQRAETTTPEDREAESESVQTAPEKAGTATPTSAAGQTGSTTPAADRAIGQAGSGRPMNDSTRKTLESRMDADLGDVRVHDDAESQEASRELNARAFTHGRDIWLGSGETDRDLGLMAHEATHVVQQDAGAGVQRQMIQRQPAAQAAVAEPAAATLDATTAVPDTRVQRSVATASTIGDGAAPPPAAGAGSSSPNTPVVQRDGIKPAPGGGTGAPGGPWDFEDKAGKLKVGSKKMVIPLMRVPTFKSKITKAPFVLKASGEEREDTQRATWEKEARGGSGIDSKLTKKIKDENAPALSKSGQPIYFLQLKGKPIYIIGNQTTIKNRSLRPYWDKTGRPLSFQVDHKHELQLGGGEGIDNLWLLEADANMSSGRNIRSEKNERIQKLIDAATKKKVANVPDLETARKSYEVTVESVRGGLPVDGQPDKHWEIK